MSILFCEDQGNAGNPGPDKDEDNMLCVDGGGVGPDGEIILTDEELTTAFKDI